MNWEQFLPLILALLLAGCVATNPPAKPADHPTIQSMGCVRMGQTVLCGA